MSSKKLFWKKALNLKVLILAFFLIFALIFISPQFGADGVTIRSITKDSIAFDAGMEGPDNTLLPTQFEKIITLNSVSIDSEGMYYDQIERAFELGFLTIKTSKGQYTLSLGDDVITTFNETTNESIEQVVEKTVDDIGITIIPTPKTNVKTGLDLSGGVRILLEPNKTLTADEMTTTLGAIEKRLNVFGLADVNVRAASDSAIGGSQFFVVEMAGATLSEIEPLLSRQGLFEAKIGNETVFTGEDILFVGKDPASGAGVETASCGQVQSGGYSCSYRFPITLTEKGAKQQAAATAKLDVIGGQGNGYLSENIDLFLDGELVDSLSIAASLKGSAVTTISISGGGSGANRDSAIENSRVAMGEFQILLESGNLPAKLSVVKADTLSADLGASFLKNALLAGIISVFAVCIVMGVRYRKLKIVIPAMLTVIFEMILLFGFAALSRWNIDLAAIAGLIIIVGTGFDHLIIITDQVDRKKSNVSFKASIKSAFSVILTAFFTTVVAMIPLYFAGAGLLQGFATTTIVGLVIAIFITRPAYAVMIE